GSCSRRTVANGRGRLSLRCGDGMLSKRKRRCGRRVWQGRSTVDCLCAWRERLPEEGEPAGGGGEAGYTASFGVIPTGGERRNSSGVSCRACARRCGKRAE